MYFKQKYKQKKIKQISSCVCTLFTLGPQNIQNFSHNRIQFVKMWLPVKYTN